MMWGIKISKFVVQMDLFLSGQSNGKQLGGSQLIILYIEHVRILFLTLYLIIVYSNNRKTVKYRQFS